jgi:hypothetical protein
MVISSSELFQQHLLDALALELPPILSHPVRYSQELLISCLLKGVSVIERGSVEIDAVSAVRAVDHSHHVIGVVWWLHWSPSPRIFIKR